MPKYGYLRKDDDGHDYVIPEELIDKFDKEYQALTETNMTYAERAAANVIWNDTWCQFAEGGSVSHYKVVMDE